jgi:hypothetical protein
MRIPLFLVVAQWTLLLALGVLVIVMYRQLGRVLRGAEPAKAGPALGSQAARFAYVRTSDHAVRYFTPGDGQPALLAFVDPMCPACEKLVAAFGEAQRAGDLDGLRVLLVTSEPPSYLQISEDFRTTALEIGRPMTRSDLDGYSASATPLLVAIDRVGVVRSAGHAMRLVEVRAFVQACLRPPDAPGAPSAPPGAPDAALGVTDAALGVTDAALGVGPHAHGMDRLEPAAFPGGRAERPGDQDEEAR